VRFRDVIDGVFDGAPRHVAASVFSPESRLVHVGERLRPAVLGLVPALRSAAQWLSAVDARALLVLGVKVDIGQMQKFHR
jgi:hypothetical protein